MIQPKTERKYPRYISATQITAFLECPLKYRTIYSGEVTRVPPNLYILYGSAIHHALETNYRQKITTRKDLPTREVIEIFSKYYVEEADKALWFWVDAMTLRGLIFQGELMLAQYMDEMAPWIQPLLVEEKFEIRLDTYDDVVIYWFFDVVTEDGIIIDHKTAWESTAKQWTQAYVDRMHQLTIYDLAYRKMFKKEPDHLRIDVLKRLKKWPEFQTIVTSRSAVQIFSLAQLMQKIKDAQKYDLFYPNYNHCDSCDFSSSCTRLCID